MLLSIQQLIVIRLILKLHEMDVDSKMHDIF